MKPIRLEEIPPGGLKIDFPLEAAWLRERSDETPLGFEAEGPLQVTGNLNKISQGILFQGRVRGRIRLICGRCLETFPREVEQEVAAQWRLLPSQAGAAPSEKDAAGRIEDLETGEVQESGLDLAERVLEEVIMGLPIKPLCRPSCQGLCPGCGANRNVSPCACSPKGTARPFSALKGLKIEAKG
jgi:uncharacterized protein